jgi:hemerythrin
VEPFLWTEDLAVGLPELDRQHQTLFEHANAFLAAARSGDPQRVVGETLDFLRKYVAHHFSHEESYMRRIGYPGIEAHAAAHRALTRHLEGVVALFAAQGPTAPTVLASMGLLRGWLLDHVADEDRAIGTYARSTPDGPP